ncbi:MAG: DUF3108 domain-containing protein [Planctomycetes bacterium]|nr:DUF3108 domain-containing protein [Planctomycetota bacterium]
MTSSTQRSAYRGFAAVCFLAFFLLSAAPATEITPEQTRVSKTEAKIEDQAIKPGTNPGQEAEIKPSLIAPKDRLKEVSMEPKEPAKVMAIDEKLRYLLKYKGLPAGESIFTVKRITKMGGQPVYYITMETESNDAIDLLYPVRDRVKSYINAENSYSMRFERSLREGKYKADDKLVYDYEKNEQTYTAIKYKGDTPKETVKPPQPIPGPVQDPLSAMYYLRHFPLKIGQSKEILIGNRKSTDILEVTPKSEEEINIPGIGVFDAYLVELGTGGEEGGKYNSEIFFSEGDLKLWVEKNTNIPLLIKIGVPILGEMTGILQSAENCKLMDYLKRKAE